MKLQTHSARDFADAIQDLLPPGQAWEWPVGGFGDTVLLGAGQEFSRIDANVQSVLDSAIELHRPTAGNWHLREYERVGRAAIADIQATMPGVELLRFEHLIKPFCVGAKVGAKVWSSRARYILKVYYSAAFIDPADGLFAALNAFKQAHVYLWMEAF